MKSWMLPWLFPVGLLATVVFFTVAGRYAGLVIVVIGVVGVVLVPVLWRVHFPSLDEDEDADVHYWRFGPR
jgi:hypothetical protein